MIFTNFHEFLVFEGFSRFLVFKGLQGLQFFFTYTYLLTLIVRVGIGLLGYVEVKLG